MSTNNTIDTRSGFHYGWVVMIGCCLIMIGTMGIMSGGSIGVYMTPAAEALGTSRTAISLYDTIRTLVMAIFQPVAAYVFKKYDVRITVALAALLCGGGAILIGLMNSVIGWYVGAVINVIGLSLICYMLIPIVLNNWFHASLGLAAGIAMSCSGVGGAIFAPIVGELIANFDWTTAIMITGAIGGAISILSALILLRTKPEDKGLLPFGYKPGEDAAKVSEEDHRGLTAKDALRSPYFYIIIISIMLIYFYGSFQIHISNYAISVGFPVEEASRVASLMMIGLVAGKILLGFVNDRLGGLATLGAAVILVLAAVITLVTSHGAVMPVFIGSFLVGMSAGSLQLVPPMIVRGSMGNKEYGKIYGWAATIGVLVSAVAAPIYAAILDATGTYNTIIAVAAGGMILALVLNLIAYGRARKLWDK